jgi:Flp pilus assembly protein TadD
MDVFSIRAVVLLALLPGTVCAGETAIQLRAAIQENLAANRLHEANAQLQRYLQEMPDDGVMHYNAACVLARLGNTDSAGTALLDSVKAGFLDFSHMRRDPDLDPLRHGEVYRAIMAASDAADPLVAERRIKRWQTAMGDSKHRIERDLQRNLDYITALDDIEHEDLRQRVQTQSDGLLGWLFSTPLQQRVLIVIPTEEHLAGLMPDDRIHGRYRHQMRELVSAPDQVALPHEVAHIYHHNHMDQLGQVHPMWIQEGLAALFEAYRVVDGAFIFQANQRDQFVRDLLTRGNGLSSLEDLMTATAADFRHNAATHYAQARSLLRFLAQADRLDTWYATYTDQYRQDPTGRAALEAALDLSLEQIDRRWRGWATAVQVRQPEPTAVRRPRPQGPLRRPEPTRATAPQIAPAPTAGLYREARALSAMGRHRQAIAALRRTLALEPEHADALYDLGLNCVLAGDLEAARAVHDTLTHVDASLASLLANLVGRRPRSQSLSH